jgi:transcriptional regulator
MYNLPQYKEHDPQVLEAFMRKHSFALLTGAGSDMVPIATQVPMLIHKKDDKFFLKGHIMRQTDHHKAFLQNPHALAVFTGPHVYVSASWYSNTSQASTWNYMSVHAHGLIRFLDEEGLYDVLRETSHLYENNPQSPTVLDNLPTEYVARLAKSIVAFELEVTKLENVFKLSQNRDQQSYLNIIEQLNKGDEASQQVAAEMSKRTSHLFKTSPSEKISG